MPRPKSAQSSRHTTHSPSRSAASSSLGHRSPSASGCYPPNSRQRSVSSRATSRTRSLSATGASTNLAPSNRSGESCTKSVAPKPRTFEGKLQHHSAKNRIEKQTLPSDTSPSRYDRNRGRSRGYSSRTRVVSTSSSRSRSSAGNAGRSSADNAITSRLSAGNAARSSANNAPRSSASDVPRSPADDAPKSSADNIPRSSGDNVAARSLVGGTATPSLGSTPRSSVGSTPRSSRAKVDKQNDQSIKVGASVTRETDMHMNKEAASSNSDDITNRNRSRTSSIESTSFSRRRSSAGAADRSKHVRMDRRGIGLSDGDDSGASRKTSRHSKDESSSTRLLSSQQGKTNEQKLDSPQAVYSQPAAPLLSPRRKNFERTSPKHGINSPSKTVVYTQRRPPPLSLSDTGNLTAMEVLQQRSQPPTAGNETLSRAYSGRHTTPPRGATKQETEHWRTRSAARAAQKHIADRLRPLLVSVAGSRSVLTSRRTPRASVAGATTPPPRVDLMEEKDTGGAARPKPREVRRERKANCLKKSKREVRDGRDSETSSDSESDNNDEKVTNDKSSRTALSSKSPRIQARNSPKLGERHHNVYTSSRLSPYARRSSSSHASRNTGTQRFTQPSIMDHTPPGPPPPQYPNNTSDCDSTTDRAPAETENPVQGEPASPPPDDALSPPPDETPSPPPDETPSPEFCPISEERRRSLRESVEKRRKAMASRSERESGKHITCRNSVYNSWWDSNHCWIMIDCRNRFKW